ncbi:MAG: glycosyl transferase [Alphaproteobacteria bacterium]|nr:glycosyl transferase [Alphaproteobacteria bacterium]
MAERVIVTGGDAKYFPLIEDLCESVRAQRDAVAMGLVVIDAGLTSDQCNHLAARYGARVIKVGWEFPEAEARSGGKEYVKMSVVRAFLDRHCPEASLIAWVDADAWIQDFAPLELMFAAAAQNRLAIVSQTSRYSAVSMTVQYVGLGLARVRSILYKNSRNAGLPEAICRQLGDKPTLNSGVFVLAREAPHWDVWRARMGEAIKRGRVFTVDQLSIGLMTYVDGMPVELCPETCNYMGPWKASEDGKALVEFYTPYARVGVVHMAGRDEMRADPTLTIPIPTVDGREIHKSLRRAAWRG